MALTPDTDQFSQFLRLAFLRSPNYVAGVSGWTINQDGSVEFNNGTFRGNIVGGALYIYTGAGALGNPPQLAIVPAGTTQDPFGNAITSSKILIQANTITESGGIFRTAGAAPLIQLDGPHNAYLQYNAAAQLTETIAPAVTSDGLGNTVQAGFASYVPGTPTTFGQLLQGALDFGHSGNTVNPQVGASGINLVINSGQDATHTVEATLALISALAGGAGIVQLGPSSNTALELTETTITPAAAAGGPLLFGSNATGMTRFISDTTKGDSQAYDTGRATATAAGGQVVGSLTNIDLTGLTRTVVAGAYLVAGRVSGTNGGVLATQAVGLKSTAAVLSFDVDVDIRSATANTYKAFGKLTASNQRVATGSLAAGEVFSAAFSGRVVFSGSGALIAEGSCVTSAADIWTVNGPNGCELTVMPVG